MIRNHDNDRIAARRKTSICKSSVMNLGRTNPRVLGGVVEGARGDVAVAMPRTRSERNYLPSHSMALSVVLKCIPLCGREAMRKKFAKALEGGKTSNDGVPGLSVCATPVRWFKEALGPRYHVSQLCSLDDMFATSHDRMHNYLSEFFLMDVILNRKLITTSCGDLTERDPDLVVMAPAYEDDDLRDQSDYKYRTLIAFLPGAGIFYCARERRRSDVGCDKTHNQLDMSWLRMCANSGQYVFDSDGYVKNLSREYNDDTPLRTRWISAWRVSTSVVLPSVLGAPQQRLVYAARQCSDADGPRMPADIVGGNDIGAWPTADRAQVYNEHLASASSAKVGGRHYAPSCLHLRIPPDCLVIDGINHPHVDIVVDVAPIGNCRSRKSVVMVRNLLSPTLEPTYIGEGGKPYFFGDLQVITLHNSLVRMAVPVGAARSSKGDVGAMHPIGTRVMHDGMTISEYSTTSKVSFCLVKAFVAALATIGKIVFPDVLSVIQDTEGDANATPCAAMAGDVLHNRVGCTIDMSVNLANASHFDVNDASQGFSVWTEDIPGMASDWYFVMPNLHGVKPDGSKFNGVAIKLRHGTAISWDGRTIRHCTSLSRPDGPGTNVAGQSVKTVNHVYGTFTAAKERIVQAGRKRAAIISKK